MPDDQKAERCHAGKDGDCVHPNCPQLRDGEPRATGRHCPLDVLDTEGPRGTYGCACFSRDAAECHRLRYGIVAGDASHGAEECYCLCHQWGDDEDDHA